MNYEAVIFDLDGTLVNSLEDLADSTNLMLESYGFPQHETDAYRYFVGNGSRNLIRRALPKDKAADEDFVGAALERYKGIYAERTLNKTKPYDGILPMLERLSRASIPLGICTNKHQSAAEAIVRALFPPGLFRTVSGDRPGLPRKPDPAKVLRMAKEWGISHEKIAYLGDSAVDMETARRAGFLPVGVLWGFRGRDELTEGGAEVLLSAPGELFTEVAFAGLH